jgi:hypothetical protein
VRQLIIPLLLIIQSCASIPDPETDHINQQPSSSRQEEIRELERELARLKQQSIQDAMAEKDITLGMSIEQVLRVWGEPHEVGYAGDPGTGNERWVYSEGLPSRLSLAPGRIIYFEGGHVSGWETTD